MLLPLVHLLALPALAAEPGFDQGIDAHGFRPEVSSGDPSDPLSLWRPRNIAANTLAGEAILEYAKRPLALYGTDDDSVTPVLDDVLALNLGAYFAIRDNVALTFQAPVYLHTVGWDFTNEQKDPNGVGLGDIRVAAPISVLVKESGGLGVVPFVDLPSGNPRLFLGDAGISGGAIVAADHWFGPIDLTGNLGFDAAPSIVYENLRGGSHLLAALDVGWLASPKVGVHLEGVLNPAFSPNEVKWTESPGELRLTARGRPMDGGGWIAGGAVGITPGAGAASFRVFLGGNLGTSIQKDSDGDGLVDKADSCPTEPETVNQYKDEDGCPDQLAQVTIHVVDEAGQPVPGAKATIGGQTYTADATGLITMKDVMPGTALQGAVSAPKFKDGAVSGNVVEGANDQTVKLAVAPGKLTINVKDEAGQPLNGHVVLQGKTQVPELDVGADGTEQVEVPPGTYTALVSADGYASVRTEVTVEGGTDTAKVDATLKKAKVVVTKQEVQILEQVQFDFGKATIKPESFGLLDEVAEVLRDNPQLTKIEVQGHTDDKGSDSSNMKLSQARVDSVVKYLVEKGGIAKERLVAKGYGETKPMVPNTSDANRAKNRRVQFEITEIEGRPVTGQGGTSPERPAPGQTPAPTPAPAPSRPGSPAPK